MIYVFPADLDGCGHYRMIWPAQALIDQGMSNIRIIMPAQRGTFMGAHVHPVTGRVENINIPEDATAIVVQRITHEKLVEAIPMIRARGVAVVIDIDDDLSALPPKNRAFEVMHPKFGQRPDHSWKNTQLACEASTTVVASTEALIPVYGGKGNARVIKNHVPSRYFDVKHYDSPVFGWGGSVYYHPDDLEITGNAVRRLTNEGYSFRIIGDGDGVRAALGLNDHPEITGIVDLRSAWPDTLSSLGVGMAPLSDTRFNRSKSWLKMLEMASLGVPSVSSPRAEYTKLHNDAGIGFLAHKPQQWYRFLKKLLDEEPLRREMSEAGREAARAYTLEDNAWQWYEAWMDAIKQERATWKPLTGKKY
jgi:glycosyltransferase involved in cell wall biosynthesis